MLGTEAGFDCALHFHMLLCQQAVFTREAFALGSRDRVMGHVPSTSLAHDRNIHNAKRLVKVAQLQQKPISHTSTDGAVAKLTTLQATMSD